MRLLSAMLLGYVAGSRSMLAPAAASWATRADRTWVHDSPLWFMEEPFAPLLLSTLATGEIVADKLPFMPSRRLPLHLRGAC